MGKPDYTLVDYVRWMGAFTFEERPFCDLDALVLCDVIYFDLFNSETSPGKTLRELIPPAPIKDRSIVKQVGGGLNDHLIFIEKVSASRRFGEIRVKSYSETLNYEKSIQFAAADFSSGKLVNFIAFRGTDDTIAGWREDFMIAFTKTAAQDKALEFVKANLDPDSVNYIGGHSKGGNLALYAASMLPIELQDTLEHVYDLDGPGFSEEVFDLKLLDKIQDKTTFIIPEFCVIGKLLEPDLHNKKIAASNETAVMQHELLSWGANENGVQTVPDNDPGAKEINLVIDQWVRNTPKDDRRVFVNEVFDTLEKDGAKTITDLMKNGPDGFEKILFRAMGASETTKRTAAALPEQAFFGNLLRDFREKGFVKFVSTNRFLHSLFIIAIGFLVMFAPDNLLDFITLLILLGLTVIQIVVTVKRLIENHWSIEAVGERLQFCLILIVLTLCLFFRRATVVLGSFIFLLIAFSIAMYCGIKAKDANKPRHIRLLSFAECLAGNIFAICFLIIPEDSVYVFSFSIGLCLIIDGLVRILFEVLESRHILKPLSDNG